MSLVAVTIRLHWSDNYSDRLESVQGAMTRAATSDIWDEATSLYIFEASETSADLLDAIKYAWGFNLREDSALVMNLTVGTHQSHGYDNEALLNRLLYGMRQAA